MTLLDKLLIAASVLLVLSSLWVAISGHRKHKALMPGFNAAIDRINASLASAEQAGIELEKTIERSRLLFPEPEENTDEPSMVGQEIRTDQTEPKGH